ncbi:MAG: carbohydrate binding domain-containing protein, partial [Planctomycetia bacterium]|nr:carbohydrate binding domain-containing protein [Planctomycetia bacterium]
MNCLFLKNRIFHSIALSVLLIGMCGFLMLGSNTLFAAETDLFPFKAEGQMFRPAPEPAGSHGFIRAEGDQFVNDDGPVRFWGVNLCMSGNFPDKETATAMARRMACFGINAVRLHHMDLREIWGKNFPRQTEIDPEKLDRLDWLISQFKLNGIYVNINLHVSKKMQEVDGFSDYKDRPNHDKGIDNYEPRLIQLQKKYAKDLLTHVNPYTKNAYINEPAVAMIEINNENSIISSYFTWNLDNKCPEVYAAPLRVRWNQWLKEKYKTTEELNKAWKLINVPITVELIEDGSFEKKTLHPKWHLEKNDQSAGSLSVAEGSLLFEIMKNGKYEWQPQIYYAPITIKKGMPYTISFRARADEDGKSAELSVYPTKGIMKAKIVLQKEWKEYTFTMAGSDDIEKARIGFTLLKPGKYWFDNISLKTGGRLGLSEKESLENGNVHLIKRINNNDNSAIMRADYMKFLLDLEDGYWQEMYHYVKNELKARPPITGTQLDYGSAFAQGKLDYVDNHSYWNHPSFPGGAWDGNNWFVKNKPLVNELGTSGSLAVLGGDRIIGRPYTVSEYNHPYPNLYAAEGFPMIAALAGFQNWNGIFIFAWGHTFINSNAAGFFDVQGNPFALVHFPACYNLFVRGDVKNGKNAALALKTASIRDLRKEFETDAFCKAINGEGDAKNNLLSSPRSKVFEIYSGVRLNDLKIKEGSTAELPSLDQEKYMELVREKIDHTKSSTGELIWNAQKEGKGCFIVDTEKTKVFSGFPDGRTFTLNPGIKLIPGKSHLDWMTIKATELQEFRWLFCA